jgi:SAM-dependent methyltransferase
VYNEILRNLRQAYGQKVDERDQKEAAPWKVTERARFLAQLQRADARTLLEIGAGTGRDSLFFQQQGLAVISTDASPAMVARCREKGLNAHVMDFASLNFPPASFDGVYALNCLLHVPKVDLPLVLERIRGLLRPRGLFFWGQYGGVDQEGIYADDHYEPKRFFVRYTDEQIRAVAVAHFEIVSFHRVPLDDRNNHFQALILRRPAEVE